MEVDLYVLAAGHRDSLARRWQPRHGERSGLAPVPGPPYPDFPCALPTSAGAAAESLRQFFGTDAVPFTRTVNAPPVPLPDGMPSLPAKVITRSYATLSDSTAEAQNARVYAGLHFREGCQAGARQGIQIARFVARQALRPAKGLPAKHK